MRNSMIGAAVAAICLSLSLASPARAQAPKMAPGTGLDHDISGVWGAFSGGAHPPQSLAPRPQPPVMTSEGQAHFKQNTSELTQGLPVMKSPAFQCLPAGPLQG